MSKLQLTVELKGMMKAADLLGLRYLFYSTCHHPRILFSLEMPSSDSEPVYVLAVDDNSVDRALIAGLLRLSNYRVSMVDSTMKALEQLESKTNVSIEATKIRREAYYK